MCITINLDRESQFWTVEIKDVVSNAMLASEFQTQQLPTTHIEPQSLFRRRRVVPQVLAEAFLTVKVI